MAAPWEHTPDRAAGSPLSGDIGARVAAIVHAAEREAQAAERAIADRRRAAEEEVQRYLAAARLRVDAEAAARAARLEALGTAARRLVAELSDATSALTHELRGEGDEAALPHTPWPAPPVEAAPAPPPISTEPFAAPAPTAPPAPPGEEPAPEPTWSRGEHDLAADWTNEPAQPDREPDVAIRHEDPVSATNGIAGAEVPSAARLVAIEMAVGGSSRAEVEHQLREQFGTPDPQELLDDVFGAASHAGSTLAWGQP
jgi:hypothetical protein